MIPLFFGNDDRPLFGLFTPPASRSRRRAVLLCHPWGQEYLRAHRSMHQLARRLAAAGHPVLKFDYSGTGDSGGEMIEATLAHWQADIGEAIAELRDASGARKVSLVGLRLGAALAAEVALQRPAEVDSLVLWDPVWNGRAWLDEVCSMRGAAGVAATARPAAAGGGRAVLGFAMSDTLLAEIGRFELAPRLARLACPRLVVTSAPADGVVATLPLPTAPLPTAPMPVDARGGGAVEHVSVIAPPCWLEDRNLGAGAIPAALLQRIEQWLH